MIPPLIRKLDFGWFEIFKISFNWFNVSRVDACQPGFCSLGKLSLEIT
jgi:hypothetical protein